MNEIIKEQKIGRTLSDVFTEVFNKLKKILGGGKSKIVSDKSAQQVGVAITSSGGDDTGKIILNNKPTGKIDGRTE